MSQKRQEEDSYFVKDGQFTNVGGLPGACTCFKALPKCMPTSYKLRG